MLQHTVLIYLNTSWVGWSLQMSDNSTFITRLLLVILDKFGFGAWRGGCASVCDDNLESGKGNILI